MASKNMMKNTIVLFLTINLVFLGFTVAQAPPPQALVCPRSLIQVQPCVIALRLQLLTSLTLRPCCNLVRGLETPEASVCICNAALQLRVLNVTISVGRIDQVLGVCGIRPLPGFICA